MISKFSRISDKFEWCASTNSNLNLGLNFEVILAREDALSSGKMNLFLSLISTAASDIYLFLQSALYLTPSIFMSIITTILFYAKRKASPRHDAVTTMSHSGFVCVKNVQNKTCAIRRVWSRLLRICVQLPRQIDALKWALISFFTSFVKSWKMCSHCEHVLWQTSLAIFKFYSKFF